jgi:hypothetical protein
MSLGTAYITEANECHETFVEEVIDRTLASKKRQLFFDLNPKPPRHWFYTDILNYQDELREQGRNPGYNYGHFTIADNRSIPPDKLKIELDKYDKASIWYQRDILGKRIAASGRIYTSYSYDDVAIKPEDIRQMQFQELTVGVDVGGTDATVATLTGLTRNWREAVHIDGMYHKQGIDNKMDSSLYAKITIDVNKNFEVLVYSDKKGEHVLKDEYLLLDRREVDMHAIAEVGDDAVVRFVAELLDMNRVGDAVGQQLAATTADGVGIQAVAVLVGTFLANLNGRHERRMALTVGNGNAEDGLRRESQVHGQVTD